MLQTATQQIKVLLPGKHSVLQRKAISRSQENIYRFLNNNGCNLVPSVLACGGNRAFFNHITTGAFIPVGPLLAPVVKQYFQMSWALLIISKNSSILKKLHLHAF
jgi:hypothetical protein